MHLVSEKEVYDYIIRLGFDAVNISGQARANVEAQGVICSSIRLLGQKVFNFNIALRVNQKKINKYLFCQEDKLENVYPTLVPNFDRTPRTNKDFVYHNSTPEVFEKSIIEALTYVENKEEEHKIIILKSWNEWGEGNYVEPDIKYGRGYIDALARCLK